MLLKLTGEEQGKKEWKENYVEIVELPQKTRLAINLTFNVSIFVVKRNYLFDIDV